MDSHSPRNLAFLLSLGVVPLACNGDDGTTDASAGATTTAGSDSDTGTETTGETTSTTDPTTTDPTTTDPTTTDPTTTDGETTTTGTPDGTCEGYAAKYTECYGAESYREALADCEQTLQSGELISPACAAAYAALFDCFSGLECRDWETPEACEATYIALDRECVLEPGEVCVAYGAKAEECNGADAEEEASECQFYVAVTTMISEACGQANEDFYACLAALDCADFDDPEEACAPEIEAINDNC